MRLPSLTAGPGALFKAFRSLLVFALAASILTISSGQAHADTTQFKGVNWADQRDNFINGVLYVSGLSSSDTYSSAATVADQVVGQMYEIAGANTVRMPINEPTVSQYWGTYTGAIDAALTKGKVILAYWAYTGGRPPNMSAFDQMWDRVIARYGDHPNAYFEVINEPNGFSYGDLNNFYSSWLSRYSNVPRSHVILDGAATAQYANPVGDDSRLDGTLIGIHDYSFFGFYDNETQWEDHIANYIGRYASRVVVTEWGGAMGPGTKNGVYFDTIDYNIPSGSYFSDYIRGVARTMRELGVGSVYWPGLRDGDWYSMTRKSGGGSNISLSLVNRSGLDQLHYAWGMGDAGSNVVKIRNVATGLYLDGMGRTGNGANAGQWGDSSSYNQQWIIENAGYYVRIKNRATGLYLDGMGRTSNGATAGQWGDSGSSNQQWSILTGTSNGNDVRIRNRATGLFLDGMGRAANGSDCGQWGDSNSTNQQWRIVAAS